MSAPKLTSAQRAVLLKISAATKMSGEDLRPITDAERNAYARSMRCLPELREAIATILQEVPVGEQ